MRRCFISLVLGALVLWTGLDSAFSSTGPVKDFKLTDHLGKTHQLHTQTNARAVVLFYAGNGCPIVRKSILDLKAIREVYEKQGVVFWMVNANMHDDITSIQEEAKEFGITFPILKDQNQKVTRALGVRRTAEVLVINPKNWKV